MIRDAVHKNLEKLARLEKANKASGVRVASLERLGEELRKSLEEKAAMVAELESRIGNLSKTVESQATSLAEKEETIHKGETEVAQKTKELNTAYVAVASKRVLTGKGVVEKRESVAGLGGRWIETGKFDPGVFREIDVTQELEVPIPAPAGKVRVVTGQPKESYEIVDGGPNSKSSKLAVKDPSAFWKGDRYLVVMIPD
jgi:Rad3-related DNA helicase